MKATLEFNLPKEYIEFKTATNASNYLQALQQVDNALRELIKYGDIGEEKLAVYEECRQMVFDACEDNEINL